MNKEEAISSLVKIDEIGEKTAECLYEINIKTPQDLANANANNVVQEFSKRDPRKGFYRVSLRSVKKWIAVADSGNWLYSKAETRLDLLKQRAKDKNMPIDIDRESFRQLYGMDDNDRKCAYCEIKESDIEKLIKKGLINKKGLELRGRGLEIDRKDPKKGYIHRGLDSNINLCCYWCNNAKTDEFSESEFKGIAEQIKEVWKERLKQK